MIGFSMKYISKVMPTSLSQFLASCVVHSVAMVAMANATNQNLLYMIILPMSMATMVSKISSQSYTNQVLGRGHTAYIVGITSSIMSAARLVTPIVAGYVMQYVGLTVTLYLSAASTLLSGAFYVGVSFRVKSESSDMKVKHE